ncbi:MAG: hypothetical protein ACO1RX_21905 [Candidatus Sericytochromatia bacterium]
MISSSPPLFSLFQQACAFVGFAAEWVPVSDAVPYDLLLVDARSAPEQPELPVRVFFDGDVLRALDPAGFANDSEAPPLAENLHFLSPLGIVVPEAQRLEVAQLLMSLNPLVPTGDFGLDPEGQVLCTYHLLSEVREVYPLLVVRIVRMLGFFIEAFRPVIAAVAQGEYTAAEGLSRLEQELVQAAQV